MYNRARYLVHRLLQPRDGQTNVELGAILVIVSIVSIAILIQIADQVLPMFTSMAAGF